MTQGPATPSMTPIVRATEGESTAPPKAGRSGSGATKTARRRLERLRPEDGLLLIALFLVAFFLRTANINFDQGQHQHPDERFWSFVLNDVEWPGSAGAYLTSSESTLNPYNEIKEDGTAYTSYSYGTMPLYATKATAEWLSGERWVLGPEVVDILDLAGVDLRNDDGVDRFNSGYDANLIGRLLSAVLDSGTVLLVFALGRSLSGRTAGFLGAVLYTFAALPIQYAHFLGSEPWVAFFVTATVLGSVRIAQSRAGPGTWVLTGIAAGLAVASKLSGLPSLIAPMTAALIVFAIAWRSRRPASGEWPRWLTPILGLVGAFVIGFAVFRIALPYAFQDGVGFSLGGLLERDWGRALALDERYTNDMAYIRDVNTGGGFNWVIQWVGRTPLLYPLEQLYHWGMGPALALATAVGIVFAGIRVRRDKQWYFLVPLSLIAVFVVFVALQFNPLNRYLLPAYPSAIALAGFGLVQLWRSVSPSVRWLPDTFFDLWRPVARTAVGLMVGFAVLYGIAFVNGVYQNEYTRIAASEWMVDNLPEGSVVSSQAWDDALPLTLESTAGWWDRMAILQLDPFFPDSSTKATQLAHQLDQVDYVMEASNKLYGAIPQMPAKFPATIAYYDALFDGSLGFEKVAEFTSPPSLFGFQLDDRNAEETFTVYDHPPVTIWQKTDRYSAENTLRILDPFRADIGIDHAPRQAGANALQLTPAEYAEQQAGGTWTDTFSDDGLVTNAPWFWWILWLQVAALAAVPATTWLFRRLPDHGYGFSKILGFLGVGLPVWLMVSWGWFTFSDTLVWWTLAVGAVLGGAMGWLRMGQLRRAFAEHWRSWLAAELVFLGVFGAVVLLRYANPDLWSQYRGGEKPMELSYLTAIAKSTTLPAYDPWFAGGFINYYYVGWFFLAVPLKALHMPPDIAFNLGVATYAALAGVVVHSLVANLAGAAKGVAPGRDAARSSAKAGVLGVVMFMVLGNFDALRQTWDQLRRMNRWGFRDGKVGDSVVETVGGLYQRVFGDQTPEQFDWWAPSRVNKGPGINDITEFPAWTILFGDLHPHFMGMAFFGLMLALAVALVMTLHSARQSSDSRSWVLAVALGAGAALVRMVHTWDWPTVVIVAGAAIAFGWFLAAGSWRFRLTRAIGQLVVFGASYLFFAAPYLKNNDVYDGGLEFNTPFSTNLDDFIAHWLLFLFAAVVYFGTRSVQLWRARSGKRLRATAESLMIVLIVFAPVVFLYLHYRTGSAAAWAALLAFVALALVIAELEQKTASVGHIATSGFFALGFAILSGVEEVRLRSDIDRFNTVFKFWLQVWQLFAIAGAFALWWTLRTAWLAYRTHHSTPDRVPPVDHDDANATTPTALFDDSPARQHGRGVRARGSAIGFGALSVTLAVLMLGALVFPLRGIPARNADRFDRNGPTTLEGFAWLAQPRTFGLWDIDNVAMNEDAPLIDWLRANVEGSPTIVEAWGPGYQWFNRITMTTGLPSVLGWDWHQTQQRSGPADAQGRPQGFARGIEQRKAAIQQFYTVADPAQAERFLQTYDVSYVIVGAMENADRGFSDESGRVSLGPVMTPEVRSMFESMDVLEPVFVEGRTAIYWVNKNTLTSDMFTYETFEAAGVASG